MLKKILKWVGIVAVALIVLISLAVGGLYINGTSKLSKTYTIQVETVAIPTDAAAMERGKRWASILCAGCHGDNLQGTAFFNDPSLGNVNAKNLTKGKGGIGNTYKDEDWIRALRHGVKPDGKSVFIMPAGAFYYLSDGDLGDIIAYLKNAPPVDKEWASPYFTFMATLLAGAGVFDSSFVASNINHTGPRPTAPAKGVSKEYGDYLVRIGDCRVCHGQQLSGGSSPDPSVTFTAPNLTPGGELVGWKDSDFIKAMRTGVMPDGKPLSENMPWKDVGKLSDDELKAIFTYLQSLPKLETTK